MKFCLSFIICILFSTTALANEISAIENDYYRNYLKESSNGCFNSASVNNGSDEMELLDFDNAQFNKILNRIKPTDSQLNEAYLYCYKYNTKYNTIIVTRFSTTPHLSGGKYPMYSKDQIQVYEIHDGEVGKMIYGFDANPN